MHHIFVKNDYVDLDKKVILIDHNDPENYNHLANSLRVKCGEWVLCSIVPFESTFDYKTKVCEVDKDHILLTIEERVDGNELPIKINLYQGLCKSDKLEYIIEKSVELGVHTITPLITDNSIVKIDRNDKKLKTKMERYNKISKSAAEQSRRHVIPEVLEPKTLTEALKDIKNDYNIVFYENAEDIDYTKKTVEIIKAQKANSTIIGASTRPSAYEASLSSGVRQSAQRGTSPHVNVFIGPEGGFTDKEIEAMKSEGFYILTLGKRILRTETASLTALSILMYEFEK